VKIKMGEKKKNTTIICLLIVLIIVGVANIYFMLRPEEIPLGLGGPGGIVIGTSEGPTNLDPIHSWDSSSNNVIEQVCEGLYQHNLSDPDLGIIPMLAADYGTWNAQATQLTIPLRQGVYFHDGTHFSASSVKWTFERINYFINASGMPWILNETCSKMHSLYEFPNGTTILDPINPVTINNEFNVTINLRAPYAIFDSLLCHVSAYMLSSISTPKFEYISTNYGRIVGTGPFVFDYYIPDFEVRFSRWYHYWGDPAFFEDVTLEIIKDNPTRNSAMLGHTIDYLISPMSSFFTTFDADHTITHQSSIQALSYYYLGMNNKRINQTWRQAISYGINYTYITDELQNGTVYRSNGPLAPYFPGYDPTIQSATFNLTKAREIVVSMGFGDIGWNDTQWQGADFQTWNYSYDIGNDFREDLLILLQDNLDLLGIEIIEQGMSYEDFINRAYGFMEPGGYDSLMLYWIGWDPECLSPFNMIAPLFSNKSDLNSVQYWNHNVEMWLEQILTTTDAAARQVLYSNILHRIVEVDMPHAFGYHPFRHYVHGADIHGVPYNALGKLYIYPMYRVN
jgi:peptide/nickel transport system substrate-binding protein